jgi:hypothetical protein
MLRRTISRADCLIIKHSSGAYDQIFITVRQLMWDALSDERTGLPFRIAADPRQRSHSRLRVPWYSQPLVTVPDSILPFSRLKHIGTDHVENNVDSCTPTVSVVVFVCEGVTQ